MFDNFPPDISSGAGNENIHFHDLTCDGREPRLLIRIMRDGIKPDRLISTNPRVLPGIDMP